jgi:L-2-hydroxyglutarate oxidase LhgO
MERIDTAIIGGGVVGLAAADAIARRGRSVCVLERESRFGRGTSTRNSQVIHAGMYYPPGSLKAQHCVAGARMLYEFCAQHGVEHERCGKLIVASADDELPQLASLMSRGRINGVEGLTLVDRAFIRAREPHVSATAAIFSPNTGVLDAEGLVRALTRVALAHDAVLLSSTELVGADVAAEGVTLHTGAESILARSVVNAAGLYADEVSAMLGGEPFRIYPCRGEYAELVPSRRSLIRALVYPLPHVHGLGVHFSKTVHGNVTLGPTAAFQARKDDYEEARIPVADFLAPAQQLIPELTIDDLRPGSTGIRPKLHPPEEPFADFLIARDDKCPRLVQAAGIESPGLTACLSIGEHVASLVEEIL